MTVERDTTRKVFRRIIPLCFTLYVISYIDRANIGYAALQMNREVGLSNSAFGLASGIFFIGYFLCEVPSNLMLMKFGARRWICRILVSWGAIAAATAFVQNETQLYILRFLLGAAEAGFFPGIILYLSFWFREKQQATTIAAFTAAIPFSYVLGGPISTYIMDHVSGFGLSGWRWMLLLEGLPAVAGGIAALFLLTDRPEQATWLSAEERSWLQTSLDAERRQKPHRENPGVLRAIADRRVLYLSAIYFLYQCGSLGVGYWLPQILKSLAATRSSFEIGLIAALPYALATIAMVVWSRRSDRQGERRRHAWLPLAAAAAALAPLPLTAGPVYSILLLCVALSGLYAFKAPFWGLPGGFLAPSAAATAIAAINSLGNLGGFAGPSLTGLLFDATGSQTAGLLVLAALVLLAAVMTGRAPR